MAETYDMVVIGGGAAGLTAGMYAARDRCTTLVIERMAPGGQVLNCEHIENYPGFPDGVAGYTLGPLRQQQAMQLGVKMQLTDVEPVRLDGPSVVLQTGSGVGHARAVIIASGSSFRPLGVPGEEAFLGRGVSHYVGLTPNTQFLDGLVPLNAHGEIITDLSMRTTVPGILAAGDVRAESARQLITAAGDGATAALAAVRYLRTGQWDVGTAMS